MSLSIQKRWEIVFLSRHQHGPHWGKKKVAEYIKCSTSTVSSWLERYDSTGDVQDLPRIGRPRVTDENEDKTIVETTESHATENIHQIGNRLKRKHVEVSERTIRRRLSESGIYSLSPSYKPLLTDVHREIRLKWADDNIDRDWDRVIFWDETTFNLSPRLRSVWRRRGQVVINQIARHAPKVHMWGCFSNNGFGKIFLFTGNLNAAKLTIIYSRALLPSAKNWFGSNTTTWYLLEDNDPKHTSVQRIDWPPYSPDVNPTENIWQH